MNGVSSFQSKHQQSVFESEIESFVPLNSQTDRVENQKPSRKSIFASAVFEPGSQELEIRNILKRKNYDPNLIFLAQRKSLVRLSTFIKKRILLRIRLSKSFSNQNTKENVFEPKFFRFFGDLAENSKKLEKIHSKRMKNGFFRFFEGIWALINVKRLVASVVFKKTKEQGNLASKDEENSLVDWFKRRSREIKTFKQNSQGDFLIIEPNSVLSVVWCFIFELLILFYFIAVPLEISLSPFGDRLEWLRAHYAVDSLLVLFFFIEMNSGYDEFGELVLSRKRVFRKYLMVSGKVDLLVFLSILVYNLALNSYILEWVPRGVYLAFRAVVLIKSKDLPRTQALQFDYFKPSPSLTRIIQLARLYIFLLLFAHVTACIWILIGKLESKYFEQSWLLSTLSSEKSLQEQYITALYWAITTMTTVGYGDYSSTSQIEKIFNVIVMLMSSALFAYSISTINGILNSFEHDEIEITNKLVSINHYMKNNNIPNDLQRRVRKYLNYALYKLSSKNKSGIEMVNMLSKNLKREVLVTIQSRVINKQPLLWDLFSEPVLVEIAMILSEKSHMPKGLIIDQNDTKDKSISVILDGKIEVFLKDSMVSLGILYEGVFGTLAFFTWQERTASIRALRFMNTYSIDHQAFTNVLSRAEKKDFEKFFMIKDKALLNSDLSLLQIKCFCCSCYGHVAKNCKKNHFCQNKQKASSKTLRPARRPMLRYNRSRSNALKDQTKVLANIQALLEYIQTCLEREGDIDDKDLVSSSSLHPKGKDMYEVEEVSEEEEEEEEDGIPHEHHGDRNHESMGLLSPDISNQIRRRTDKTEEHNSLIKYFITNEQEEEKTPRSPKSKESNFKSMMAFDKIEKFSFEVLGVKNIPEMNKNFQKELEQNKETLNNKLKEALENGERRQRMKKLSSKLEVQKGFDSSSNTKKDEVDLTLKTSKKKSGMSSIGLAEVSAREGLFKPDRLLISNDYFPEENANQFALKIQKLTYSFREKSPLRRNNMNDRGEISTVSKTYLNSLKILKKKKQDFELSEKSRNLPSIGTFLPSSPKKGRNSFFIRSYEEDQIESEKRDSKSLKNFNKLF